MPPKNVDEDIQPGLNLETAAAIETQQDQDTAADAVVGAENDATNFRAERVNVTAPIDSDTAVQFSVPAWFTLGLSYDATAQPAAPDFKFIVSEVADTDRKVRVAAEGGVSKKLPKVIGKKITLGWNKVTDVPAGISIDRQATTAGTGTPPSPARRASKSKRRSIRVNGKMSSRCIQYWLTKVIPAAKLPDYFEVGGSRYPLKGITIELASLKNPYKADA